MIAFLLAIAPAVALCMVGLSGTVTLGAAVALAGLWFAGGCATAGLLSALGSRRPDTIGDSFSGDDLLDLTLAGWWPVFLPGWLLWTLSRWLADHLPAARSRS